MAEPEEAPAHPLDPLIAELQGFSEEDIRGTGRLGSLAFDQAPQEVATILGILRDLRLEDWGQFDEKRSGVLRSGGRMCTARVSRNCGASVTRRAAMSGRQSC
jgi:hypothetical protein